MSRDPLREAERSVLDLALIYGRESAGGSERGALMSGARLRLAAKHYYAMMAAEADAQADRAIDR